MLMEGLKQRNLHNCVNLIVLADHGMEKTYCTQMEYMTDYFKKIDFYVYAGPAARIRAKNVPQDYHTSKLLTGLSPLAQCKRSPQHFKPYLTPDLPKRFHYANNIRIDKVHLLVDRQWLVARDASYRGCDGGNHGYNNEFKSMEAIFLAYGPSFKEKTEVDAFENIEVYNLMCAPLPFSGPAPQCLFCGKGPKLDTVFEVGPHQCPVQGDDHYPSPAGHTVPARGQDAVGLLGHLGTLLAPVQPTVGQQPQVLFCQAAPATLPQAWSIHGVGVTQGQDLALGLVEPHPIGLRASIQPVQIPLQSLPTLQQINTPGQLGVICELTEGALDPFVQIIYKDDT
ncbi:hypothetical protein llap_19607 [Limosa lapponica baueri]|uniref:Ectonucleotide pyrophosphatase phosphodiesterase family member 3 n=1 Tax=Limosa lapponica baueri TaxID=1758121 RepID=A0A2I0T8H4_LIMLA|nr:hypothetical protein llap_19607 [Limosa lapponica baueri]